ncbi:MAG: hypothetical protein JO129_03980, partial [Candidatus Dependentiae bacterium]|nr:hypothetical protein [Candidatus Dependentiae bacterium]
MMKRFLLLLGLSFYCIDPLNGSVAGTVDTAFNASGTNPGFENLNSEITSVFPIHSTIQSILRISDGSYFVAGSDGTNGYLTKFDSNDHQDTTFGGGAIITFPGCVNLFDMIITLAGGLFIVGYENSYYGFIAYLDTTFGNPIPGFNSTVATSNYQVFYSVAQQSNGRIIISGTDTGDNLLLVAINSVTGAIDTSFATSGIYITNISNWNVYPPQIIIDAQNHIYFVLNNASGNNGNLIQLSADGTTINWQTPISFMFAFAVIGFDQNNHVFVTTQSASNHHNVVIGLYNISNGSVAQGPATITLTAFTAAVHVQSVFLDQIGNFILTGKSQYPFVMRVLANLSGLDTTFNPSPAPYPGIQTITFPNTT